MVGRAVETVAVPLRGSYLINLFNAIMEALDEYELPSPYGVLILLTINVRGKDYQQLGCRPLTGFLSY